MLMASASSFPLRRTTSIFLATSSRLYRQNGIIKEPKILQDPVFRDLVVEATRVAAEAWENDKAGAEKDGRQPARSLRMRRFEPRILQDPVLQDPIFPDLVAEATRVAAEAWENDKADAEKDGRHLDLSECAGLNRAFFSISDKFLSVQITPAKLANQPLLKFFSHHAHTPKLNQHMIIGGLPLLVISVLNHDPAISGNLKTLTSDDIWALLYTSIFGSAISYGVFFYNATRGSLTKLSSFTFLTPVFASIFGFLYLGETFSPSQLGGAVVTLVGIYLVNYKGSDDDDNA